ncbi:MAG TPA: N-acetylmuramoyl-L-alanine amidase [Lachnospiraceae bacterium]|nr:N-acetylmuramoyl-L-alanine amidase [Lachnospiraceae bacterium]
MPRVFLSPSVQEFNPYLTGGTEEEYMNLIADAIEPYLEASGIEFERNEPNESLGEAINKSNEGEYDLHLAIHSNASAESLAGTQSGTDIYYSPNSFYGTEFAKILEKNFKNIYPNPDKVKIVPTTTLREIRRTNAPATLIEVAYHDNYEDEAWIKNNTSLIGETIARSIAEYFGVPFVAPLANEDGFVVYNLFI